MAKKTTAHWGVVLSLFVFCHLTLAATTTSVKKLYVGSMGQSDEAERFRLLLQDELGKAGFSVVDKQEDADDILTGVITIRVYADTSIARATVLLRDQSGTRLWAADFEPHPHFGGNDTVRLRAHDVAKALKKFFQKKGAE